MILNCKKKKKKKKKGRRRRRSFISVKGINRRVSAAMEDSVACVLGYRDMILCPFNLVHFYSRTL